MNTIKKFGVLSVLIMTITPLIPPKIMAATLAPFIQKEVPGELKHGRYFGYIYLDDRKEKIATTADFYLESSEDLREFPSLHAMFKLSLGDFKSTEYLTEVFNDIRYDFDLGSLTFDEGENDLLMTTNVKSIDSLSVIEGQVFIRSTGTVARIKLKYFSDEPFTEAPILTDTDDDEYQTVGTWAGEYFGSCDGTDSVLQVQTLRGLGGPDTESPEIPSSDLHVHYGIVGRIGVRGLEDCSSDYCVVSHFNSGSFSPFQNKAVFTSSRGTQICDIHPSRIDCNLQLPTLKTCTFKKSQTPPSEPQVFSRSFYLKKTPAQVQPLPEPSPPENKQLIADIQGSFAGYIHNETNDTYQALRLQVMAYSSSDNPHNPNQTNITSSSFLYYGPPENNRFTMQNFSSRSFFIRPGFTLNDSRADGFLRVLEWKRGYIRGEWFSHAFGRVGTVELIKGTWQPLPAHVKIVPDFSGQYTGTIPGVAVGPHHRWTLMEFPVEPSELNEHLVPIRGSFTPMTDLVARSKIDEGTFDPYTGQIGWKISRDNDSTFVVGEASSDGRLSLFWPPNPRSFRATMSPFKFTNFEKVAP